MNFRNKYLVTTIRTLFGLFMIFSGVSGLLAGSSPEGVPEPLAQITRSLWDSGIIHMIKITEIIAGAMLVLNVLPALAAIFLAPVAVGIIVFNAMVLPTFVIAGVIVSAFNAYLGYVYWDKYKPLFSR